MNKCLVTKLTGIVDNDSLMKVGEFSISVNSVKSPTQKSQSFIIRNSNNCVLRIVGDGYFTDETLAANKGKSLAVNADVVTTVYFSNGDYDIYISDKYSINIAEFYSCSINLDDFKYSHNISQITCSKASGSLKSVLNEKLRKLVIFNAKNVSGSFKDLKDLNLDYGFNISNISGIQNIEYLKNITWPDIGIQNCTIVGNVAILNNNVQLVSFGTSHNANLTWSNRDTEGYIIALEGYPAFADVDAMIIGQANCKATTSDKANYKIISAKGTRTSASDAAVQTLQSKGYTIKIIPE